MFIILATDGRLVIEILLLQDSVAGKAKRRENEILPSLSLSLCPSMKQQHKYLARKFSCLNTIEMGLNIKSDINFSILRAGGSPVANLINILHKSRT